MVALRLVVTGALAPRETNKMAVSVISESNFNEQIMDTNRASVLLFKSDGCHFCVELAPVYEQIANKYSDHFSFYEVDYWENQDLVELLDADGSPTIFIFTDEPYGEGDDKSRNVIEVPFPDEPPATGYEPDTLEEYLDYCAPFLEEEQ